MQKAYYILLWPQAEHAARKMGYTRCMFECQAMPLPCKCNAQRPQQNNASKSAIWHALSHTAWCSSASVSTMSSNKVNESRTEAFSEGKVGIAARQRNKLLPVRQRLPRDKRASFQGSLCARGTTDHCLAGRRRTGQLSMSDAVKEMPWLACWIALNPSLLMSRPHPCRPSIQASPA